MQVVIIDEKKAYVDDINDTLNTYYNIIKCELIDIVNRGISGKRFEIIIDDEALLCDKPRVSALDKHKRPSLVGNLIIAGIANDDGELTSLSKEECDFILKHVEYLKCSNDEEPSPVLLGLDY